MYIEKVILNNFRNYEEQIVEFNKNINVIYGDNAQGKTNILEAIFLSAFGKSFRTSKEKELIKLDKEFLNVSTFYKKSDREGKIQINISNKKEVKLNGVKLKKLSELLGNINLVIFTPDDINILNADYEAMKQAISKLSVRPQLLLNDAVNIPGVDIPQVGIIKGDTLSASIAAASIIAKVTRDRLMVEYDSIYPGYGFARNMGYGTAEHIKALETIGPCAIHRRSFITKFV